MKIPDQGNKTMHPAHERAPEFEDPALFEAEPTEWFRKYCTEWDDERIEQAAEMVERVRMVELYEELKMLIKDKDPDLWNQLP